MPTLYDTQTREPVELDGTAMQQAIASGKASYPAGTAVPVYSPKSDDTGVYQVPAENLPAALSQGYTVETPSQKAVRDYVDDPNNAGVKGSLKVAAGQAVNQSFMGLPQIVYEAKADPLEVAKWEALKKTHDLSNLAGGAVGLVSSFFNPLVNPLFKGAAATGEFATNLANRILVGSGEQVGAKSAGQVAKQIAGNLASETAGKAIEGAVISAPQALTENALGDPDMAAESLLYGAGIGGLFGAAGSILGGTSKVIKDGLGALVKPETGEAIEGAITPDAIARKIAKTITGVNEDDILHYAQNTDRVNNVGQNYDQLGLKDEIDSHTIGFQKRAEDAKAAADQASQQLNDAYNNAKVQASTAQAPRELADAIIGEQQNVKKQLGQMSDELFDTLQNSDVTIKRNDLNDLVQKQIKNLEVPSGTEGKGTIFGETANAEAGRLRKLSDNISTLPDDLNLTTVKQIIKQIDPDLNFSFGAGEFNDFTNRNGKEFRKFMNDRLRKASPEAAEILDRMSELSGTLSDVNEKFGTTEKAIANTNNLFSPKGKLNQELLQKFSDVTGKDFVTPLSEYSQAKDFLKRAKTEDLRSIVAPREYEAFMKAQGDYLQAAKDYEPISRLSPNRTQNIVKNQSFKNANIMDTRALEKLGEMTGKNYNQMIKDLNVYDQFYRERTNGSRRAVMGGALGSSLLGRFGTAIGASIGGAIDVYGGQLLKRAMDKSDNFRGLLLAEQRLKQSAEHVDKIPTIMQSMAKRVGVSPSSLSLNAVERYMLNREENKKPEKIETRHQKVKALQDKLIHFTANPEMASQTIASLSGLVSGQGAPNIGNAFNQKMTNALSYVQNALPKANIPNNPLAPKIDAKPSDADIRKFERKLGVVTNPFSVLQDLHDGTLTQDHIEALQNVYPKLYDAMQKKIFTSAVNGEIPPMPYNKRIKLSMFMGAPMDSSMKPESIMQFQNAYAQQDHSIDPSNKKQINVANQMQSEVSKLTT